MIEIILLLAFCCFVFMIALGAVWFLNMGEEGDECEGKDKNGKYVRDEDLDCVLKSCDTGYYKSGKKCLVDQSGVVCVPTGTPDPQGTYLTTVSNVCTLSSCATGYTKDGTTCSPGPSACKPDQSFDAQTGTVACESIDDFKPEAATWWGAGISNAPVSSEEATAAGMSHTFHELSSSATNKKYIAMRKTDQHCKMVEIDVTKVGPNCNYSINDAGYSGMDVAGTSGTACTATTDAEVIAQWNAKTATPTARTAATDTGYGLKSIKYSMYC